MQIPIIALSTNTWWQRRPVDGHTQWLDLSERLKDRPAAQPYRSEPPQDPGPCEIHYCSDGSVRLSIPLPVWGGGRLKFYEPGDQGVLTHLETGAIVDPTLVAPNADPRPETELK